ncbi:MAG TPA: ubiquinol oxidase subunit II [Rhizomicrobium sp.]|nr:ubiquinol oxidase subunit II [Rhizomicrobium sp.]
MPAERTRALLSRGTGLFAASILLCGNGPSVLDPAGPVGQGDRTILLDATAVMLLIVVPTLAATVLFAWHYRASNEKALHLPRWSYSGRLELVVWSIPALVITFLGGMAWIGSHALDPAQPLSSKQKDLDVDVVALDWKWLFIYPAQGIASINRLVVPAGTPVHFHITSATVFNSFFIPRLGSQIYAMNGMVTQLYLEAAHPGTYHGLSAQFSGDGFADMGFEVDAVPAAAFRRWTDTAAHTSALSLDEKAYRALLVQSVVAKPYTYRDVAPHLFEAVAMQRLPPGNGPKTTTAIPDYSPH